MLTTFFLVLLAIVVSAIVVVTLISYVAIDLLIEYFTKDD